MLLGYNIHRQILPRVCMAHGQKEIYIEDCAVCLQKILTDKLIFIMAIKCRARVCMKFQHQCIRILDYMEGHVKGLNTLEIRIGIFIGGTVLAKWERKTSIQKNLLRDSLDTLLHQVLDY